MPERMTHEPGEQDSHEFMGALNDFNKGVEPKVTYSGTESVDQEQENMMENARKAAEEEDQE